MEGVEHVVVRFVFSGPLVSEFLLRSVGFEDLSIDLGGDEGPMRCVPRGLCGVPRVLGFVALAKELGVPQLGGGMERAQGLEVGCLRVTCPEAFLLARVDVAHFGFVGFLGSGSFLVLPSGRGFPFLGLRKGGGGPIGPLRTHFFGRVEGIDGASGPPFHAEYHRTSWVHRLAGLSPGGAFGTRKLGPTGPVSVLILAMSEAGFSAETVTPMTLELPRLVSRRLLLKLLARGGMGDVYLAATTGLDGAERPCVVKTIRRDHLHDGSFLARFLDEARVQAQLNHPAVAQVLEAGTDDSGEPFTVVEYVEGKSLAEVRQKTQQLGQKIGWAEAVAITIEIAQALAHVHERASADGTPLGIVHRDLSPQNVMVGFGGEIKLIDFGTARGQNRRCHTVAGVVFAKPGYVAPEIARHEVGDGRIDVYALGVILWELCKNQRLLTGDAQKHLEDAARGRVQIPKIASSIGAPMELDDVIARMTANKPEERYVSARSAAHELARLVSKAPSTKGGERSVRVRIANFMSGLYAGEPSKSRQEFARLLAEAKATLPESNTPPASGVVESAAKQCADPNVLAGTPYRLVRKIGEGASGAVYEAEHVELDRKVALKVLEVAHSASSDAVERFRQEARTIARLRHPNVAYLHDFGRSMDGRVFLAMELLDGETLAKRMERRSVALDPISPAEAVQLGISVTRALQAAHEAGIVHRDLKPENLFLAEGYGKGNGTPSETTSEEEAAKTERHETLKLLDFGVALAKSETAGEEKKQRGFAVFGTPEYMAPEQVAGEPVDARCDLYALGCVLYELTTGHRPFSGGSAVEIMGKHVRDVPTVPSKRAVDRRIPAELDVIIMKLLEKKPEDRYETAAEVREALERVLPAASRKPGKAKKQVALLAGFAAIALTTLFLSRRHDASPAATAAVAAPQSATSAAPAEVEEPMSSVAAASPLTVAPAPVPALPVASAAAPVDAAPTPSVAANSGVTVAESPTKTLSLEAAREMARAKPRDPKALRAWTRAALRSKEYGEAKEAAELWLARDGSAEPRIVLANVLERGGKRAEAKALLELYVKKHPQSSEAKRALARLGGGAGEQPSQQPRAEKAPDLVQVVAKHH
ncbi:MAG: protein kinase [Polyangiaceae bacterium]